MVRQKECIGYAMLAFGAGMIVALILQSIFCPVIIGVVCIVGGGICIR